MDAISKVSDQPKKYKEWFTQQFGVPPGTSLTVRRGLDNTKPGNPYTRSSKSKYPA